MGVNLSDLVSGREIGFEDLRGKAVAIDAHNTIYQFLSSIRDRMTGEPLRDSRGRVTSHLSGLFYRTARMVEAGMRPVFVFDGKPPDFKEETSAARRQTREEAERLWKRAVKEGDTEGVRRHSQQASRLTQDMIKDSRTLLSLMGIPSVQAPSEGEAQASHLLRQGKVWAVGSQDWDSLLFGADRLVKNLTITGRRKIPRKEAYITVKPELVELSQALSSLGMDREQLITMGILVGTDYNQGGVRGIGPKKALHLVKEHRTLERVLGQVEWEFSTPARRIFDFFMEPHVEDIDVPEAELDPEGLRAHLIDEHGFSAERVDNTLRKLQEASEKGRQSSLGKFFLM